MRPGVYAYWGLVTALIVASIYFVVDVEQRRDHVQAVSAALTSGDLVRMVQAVDGDTLVIASALGDQVTVRLLGIQAFAPANDGDPAAIQGHLARNALARASAGKPMRIYVHTPDKDKEGRTLATLFVDDRDLGMDLVAQGLVLAYTVYPFPAMQLYVQHQELARAQKRGLWHDADLVSRADALIARWRSEAP